MREILFRGKRVDNGEWICSGNLITFNQENGEPNLLNFIPERNAKCVCTHDEADNIIGFEDCLFAKVIPDTVGQYTGLKDKNGVKIFDGDIVKITDDFGDTDCIDGGIGEVCFAYGLWYVCGDVNNGLYDSDRTCWIEVIGNIYDSRELLEVLK